MKFKIRFADQIVGILIIAALAALIAVIIALGGRQRWFKDDLRYKAFFESAQGLNVNMAVQYKGITIGKIDSFKLMKDTDKVETDISIYEEYTDLLRKGTIVELRVSPIGLGNSFYLYPGLAGQPLLAEGTSLPVLRSPEAMALVTAGLATAPLTEEGVSAILASVQSVLQNINTALQGPDGENTLGSALANIQSASSELSSVLESLRLTVNSATLTLNTVNNTLTEPGGVLKLVDSDGALYNELSSALISTNKVLNDAVKTSDSLPGQMPQITAAISQLRTALESAQNVLTAMTNNPLLKGGVPEQANTNTGGTGNRGGVKW
ncbi:MAG: MlaD family protein [Spirochaetaceae bacterium]|jgi:phospholipid/cholesterol/gamma-HCH transport system substrate-binding protein|nr:MlaD family protein [Spirochaetaceae bacterium]